MDYQLITAVWELTMGCNMRCKHCGSSCEGKLEGELTTQEALNLCDELKGLGINYITLSGGEPTIREDWPVIAGRLNKNGITTNIITNAWLLNEALVQKAKEANVNTMAISIDGMEDTHDYIRRPGSFKKDIKALKLIKDSGIYPAVITTVNCVNINELVEMYDLFNDLGVVTWQLQMALPMGNFAHQTELYLEPEHVDQIIDFAHSKKDGNVGMVLADCMGYYNDKALEVAKSTNANAGHWQGCSAGKYVLGILHNGDITACTSLRSRDFIEGNIRERTLSDIWHSEDSFKWNREFKKDQLTGLCAKCQYGQSCLGGCCNTRLCMNDDVCSENKYCSYHVEMVRIKKAIDGIGDMDRLHKLAYVLIHKKQFQSAGFALDKLLLNRPGNIAYMELSGYVNFELQNYGLCEEINRNILRIDPENAYASKGLGLALYRSGDVEGGLIHLYNAIHMREGVNAEIYFDLCVVLFELQRNTELLKMKNKAKSCEDYSEWQPQFDRIAV